MGAGQSRSKRRTAISMKNLPQAYKNCQQNYKDLQKKCHDESYQFEQNFDNLTYNDNDNDNYDIISQLPSVPNKYGGKRRTRRKRITHKYGG